MTAGRDDGARPAASVLAELARSLTGDRTMPTSAAPHVRSRASTDRLLLWFVLASAPALGVGCWNLGGQLMVRMDTDALAALAGWRRVLIVWLGAGPAEPSAAAAFVLGLSYLAPLLVVAFGVAVLWEVAFATLRRRPTDPGWLMTAWLFAALLPPSMPLPAAALGLSFGIVFGSHVFGGTGRYLLSPALVGAVFLNLAHPGLFATDRWLPGLIEPPTWAALAADGVDALAAAGTSWGDVLVGREIGALGTASALACALGAAVLIGARAAAWRTVAGGVLGVVLASALFNVAAEPEMPAALIPWHWHLATGSLAFGLAFIATDPTTTPLTRTGRWLHGGLVGALAVVVRVANPEHPEGTLFALVIAGLFTPLVDHAVVAVQIRMHRRSVAP